MNSNTYPPIAGVDLRVAGAKRSAITYVGNRRRAVRTEGWVITQVRESDGTWWNLRIERDR